MTKKQKQQVLASATAALTSGQLAQAEGACVSLLAADPDNAEAFYLLGWINHRLRRGRPAVENFRRAVELDRNDERFHNGLGVVFLHLGVLDRAVQAFRAAIAVKPQYADAYGNLGRALALQGQEAEARVALERAVALAPNQPEILNNYGNLLRRSGQAAAALTTHERALKLRPNLPQVHYNIGQDLHALGQTAAAAAAFDRAVKLKPDHVPAMAYLAYEYFQLQRWPDAKTVFERLLSHAPDHPESHLGLGLALERLGERERALVECRRALELKPGWTMAEYHVAALEGRELPHDYHHASVTKLFDDYAATFDEHLVKSLQYVAHRLVYEAVVPLLPPEPVDLVDVGCGTGLCGSLFEGSARSMIGIDLSASMIDKARERGVYEELVVGDAVDVLKGREERYDVAVAADVLIYLGELTPMFTAVSAALRPGGIFAFSIEALESGDFALGPSRRYAYSMPYVERIAGACGMTVEGSTAAVLRKEMNADVRGFIVVLRKPR